MKIFVKCIIEDQADWWPRLAKSNDTTEDTYTIHCTHYAPMLEEGHCYQIFYEGGTEFSQCCQLVDVVKIVDYGTKDSPLKYPRKLKNK